MEQQSDPQPVTAIADLQPGDIIRHKSGSEALVVTANYGGHAIAVRTQHVSNPQEWLLIGKGPAHR